MLDTATPIDKPHVEVAGKLPDRPLIHDIMPKNLGEKSADAAKPQASAKSAEGGILDMPPADYGSYATGYQAQKGIATPVDPADKKADPAARPGSIDSDKPDPFMSNADKLAQSAHDKLGQDLTVGPRGAHLGHVPKKFGCAASVSNVLHDDGVISLSQMSASVDGVEKTAMHDLHGERVPFANLQKGDLVIGRGERDGSGGRHIGVVDTDANGKLVAYNNHGGKFKSDPLADRFGPSRYQESYGIRIFK